MQYFSDGLDGLIRVDTDASPGSREFFFAKAEKLGSDGAWYPRQKLIFEILNSGYYQTVTNNNERTTMSNRQSCFNPDHHDPHTREEVREDVFAFTAWLAADTDVDLDPQGVWDECQKKMTIRDG